MMQIKDLKQDLTNTFQKSRPDVSSCKFPRRDFQCFIKYRNLRERFQINAMLTTNDPVKLKYLEKYSQNKRCATLKNPSSNS